MQPRQMRRFVDEAPVLDGDDFIDPVGELKAAILDMHRGFAVRKITAIDIGDTRHGCQPGN